MWDCRTYPDNFKIESRGCKLVSLIYFLMNLPGLGEVGLYPGHIALHSDGTKAVAMSRINITAFNIETGQILVSQRIFYPIQAAFIGDKIAISSSYRGGLIYFECLQNGEVQFLPGLFPRYFTQIGENEILGLPFLKNSGEGTFSIRGWKPDDRKTEGILGKVTIDFDSKEMIIDKNWIAPITKEQDLINFNFKEFWTLGNSKSFYLVRAVQNQVVLVNNMAEVKAISIELPGWVAVTARRMPEKDFSKFDYHHKYVEEIPWGDYSRILGAFEFKDGFVVGYVGPTKGRIQESQIAVYDKEWRLMSSNTVPGMLFGAVGNRGYFLSPWKAGHQEVFTIDLK